jgi:hypothetical protein
MTIEFGLPKDYQSAISRIPNILDPLYGVDKPTTGCANFRTYLTDITTPPLYKGCEVITRSMKMTKDEIVLLHKVNSFRRSNSKSNIYQWSRIESDQWATIFPLGDNNYRWWEITPFEPSTIDSDHSLYCVEMNKQHLERKTSTRFDEKSFFVILLATQIEIDSLRNELLKNDSFT